ncbi:DUF3892 domain-containing protein [Mesorhizobium sp. ZC-5]|uniref:DUF3892 domain-containing protein n=1 Tax=Mesorhizobium sp. ZC-5 TaxID=2986066 RepID=UPI0021E76A80|nr:DUF3892 domain-containing protein [Mesorhizobium sp. ZC-5]MCV3239327.1 DUF3892 domain-containing protein [Mesorhizobium sp. ZC-5]
MTGTYQVTCHTPDNADKDRRLQGVGGPGGDGWYRTVDQMIAHIEGGDRFWTVDQHGNSVWLMVSSRNGRKYIKTESDGVEPNNLLALPHCR